MPRDKQLSPSGVQTETSPRIVYCRGESLSWGIGGLTILLRNRIQIEGDRNCAALDELRFD
jgi:hypothetical protein